jgi:hypothetical protein
MSSRRSSSPGHQSMSVTLKDWGTPKSNFTQHQARPAGQENSVSISAAPKTYLTRSDVAQRYPISSHTLAKLASQGKGPRYFKPTDKCLYLAEDVEAWIEAAAILPGADNAKEVKTALRPSPTTARNGRGKARPAPLPPTQAKNGRKSLPPSANSWLRRTD